MAEIPTCIEDLSKEWLRKTLSEALKVQNIEILDLKPIASIGYLSQALKATFKVKDSDPEKIFIKINLSDDSHFTFVGKHGIYLAEIKSYQEILPTLIKYEVEQFGISKLKTLIPKYFAGNHSVDKVDGIHRFFLILEDLSDDYHLTFFNYSKDADVAFHKPDVDFHIKCLESIAYFHAISYSYGKVNSIDFTEFNTMLHQRLFNEKKEKVKSNLNLLKDDMTKMKLDAKMTEALTNLEKHYVDILPKYLDLSNPMFLSHGDYWTGNVMIHNENKDGK